MCLTASCISNGRLIRCVIVSCKRNRMVGSPHEPPAGRSSPSSRLAVFMASLDLFIVNIAFPDIRARLRRVERRGALSWVLNAYAIVFAALLVPAGPPRRPDRPQARLPRRPGSSSPAPRRCAPPRRRVDRARRRPGAPGGGRRPSSSPTSLGAAAAGVPARAPRRRRRRLGRRGRRGGGRSARRSAACSSRRAGAGCSWSTCPSRIAAPWCRRARPARGARARAHAWPDLVGSAAARRLAIGAARRSAIVKGTDWGWGSAHVVGLLRRRRGARRRLRVPLGAPPGPRGRAELLRVRSFAVANRAPTCSSSPPSGRCCSAACLFLTSASGTDSMLTAGLALAPGP